MFHTRTGRFKVETSWQELVNRRIQKIEIDLKEIALFNRAGFLLAKGSFRREIIYIEFDGKFRRGEDRVQFEVVIGKELPEPFPMLKTELKQDYYIFQPRQLGDNQAVLEQGFSLTVQEMETETETIPELSETIIADCIVDRGSSSQLVQIGLGLEESFIGYHDFHGTIQFEPAGQNLLNGKVEGILEYFTTEHHLKTWVVEQSVSWLWEKPMEEEDIHYIVNGSVHGSPALFNTDGNWVLELKIDYSWILFKKRDLACVIFPPVETGLSTSSHKIKAEILLEGQELRLPKFYDLSAEGMTPVEVNIMVVARNDRFGKKGLLLESLLKIEAYGRSPDGVEIYRHWEVSCSELIAGYEYLKQNDGLRLDAPLQLRDIHFEATNCGLKVGLILCYQLKIYQLKVIDCVEDKKNGVLVHTLELVDLKNFSVMKEATVHLRRKPLVIDGIGSKVIHLNSCIKQGWFQITGDLECTISYHHVSGKSYQEVRTEPFSESFLWEQGESDWEIQLNPVIEFDTYQLEGMNVLYKYLLHFDVGFYRMSALMLKTQQSAVLQIHPSLALDKRPEQPPVNLMEELRLVLEREIPLQFGIPREISRERSYISRFNYRDAANAILAEGTFGTDLEYWDEDGFLRQERLDMPFWKFVPYGSNQFRKLSGLQLFPEILRTSVMSVNAWPWQKGAVKISIELVLKRSKGEH